MTERRSATPSVMRPGGETIASAGVRTNSIRAGVTFMKSVSRFLTGNRKPDANGRRQTSSAATTKQEIRKSRQQGRTMSPEVSGGVLRNSARVAKIIESLKKRTKFSRVELDSLCKLYKKLIANANRQRAGPSTGGIYRRQQPKHSVEGIDRAIFRDLLHNTFNVITEDTLIERMFCCWDRESEVTIRLEPWILGLDVFLRGGLHDKLEFCFRVYDLNNDGYIAKDEIFQLFKNCLVKQPGEEDPDESVRDLSELVLKKLDVDRDGKISFKDYETAIKEEPLLVEAFGQCLPTEPSCAAFLKTLQQS